MPRIQIVLPARLHSTRLPEKLLQRVAGKSVLHHTYERATLAQCCSAPPVVAVDDERLAQEVAAFGGRWVMTPRECPSGTDRIAEAARHFPEAEIFVNVQSDEPEINPGAIDAVAEALCRDGLAEMSTAATPIRHPQDLSDPNLVKVVLGQFSRPNSDVSAEPATPTAAGQGRAIYFSRACVPADRGGEPSRLLEHVPPIYWHHLGLYAYRRAFLQWFTSTPPSVLEEIEKLEQLRAIEAGKKIIVAQVDAAQPGIDTAADLDAFRRRAAARADVPR